MVESEVGDVSQPISYPGVLVLFCRHMKAFGGFKAGNEQGDICTGEREHGILWVVEAERSFSQGLNGGKCCLKGGRGTGWETIELLSP